MSQKIVKELLKYSQFYFNYKIEPSKVLLIVNNLVNYTFKDRKEKDDFLINDLDHKNFIQFPDTDHFLNVNFINYIQIRPNGRVKIYLNTDDKFKLPLINTSPLVEDLWSENVDLRFFLNSIKNSNINFLEYSESDRLIYVNTNNIDESEKLVDHKIIFTNKKDLLYKNIDNISFPELLNKFKKQLIISKEL